MKTTKRQSRGNGQGTLERRGNIYFARWVVAGKRFTRSTGTGDKREAEKRLAEFVKPFDLKSEKATLESLAGKVQGITAELAAYEEARPALPAIDGKLAGAAVADAAEGRFSRLCEVLDGMDAAELRNAANEIRRRLAK